MSLVEYQADAGVPIPGTLEYWKKRAERLESDSNFWQSMCNSYSRDYTREATESSNLRTQLDEVNEDLELARTQEAINEIGKEHKCRQFKKAVYTIKRLFCKEKKLLCKNDMMILILSFAKKEKKTSF